MVDANGKDRRFLLIQEQKKCTNCKHWDGEGSNDDEYYGDCKNANMPHMLLRIESLEPLIYSKDPVPTIGKFCCLMHDRKQLTDYEFSQMTIKIFSAAK